MRYACRSALESVAPPSCFLQLIRARGVTS